MEQFIIILPALKDLIKDGRPTLRFGPDRQRCNGNETATMYVCGV